jgi:secretion/DNA translocation related TadE-like protein
VSNGQRPDLTERGSASIFVLVGAALLLLIGLSVAVRTTAVLARHRAESAADLAALAGAAQIGVSSNPCSAAQEIARANRARLVDCRADVDDSGRSGTVITQVEVDVSFAVIGRRTVRCAARAARLP